jgi:hypothetical protein
MNKEQDIPGYLCKQRGFHSKTQFGCAGCRAGFHIECFTAFHCKDGLRGNMKTLLDMIKASEIADKNHRKKSTYVGSLESLQLPSPPMKIENMDLHSCKVTVMHLKMHHPVMSPLMNRLMCCYNYMF